MDINSMDINQLKATIDRLNRQSTQVNTVRNQNIGKRKTLEAQCAELFKQYSEKYGVELTQETLQEEIQRVTAEKEKEVQQLSAVLSAIDSGDYAHANALMGIEYQDEALKEALANNGVSTDRVMQEQEIMSRDFNKPVSTGAAEQMAQRVMDTGKITSAVVEKVMESAKPFIQASMESVDSLPDKLKIVSDAAEAMILGKSASEPTSSSILKPKNHASAYADVANQLLNNPQTGADEDEDVRASSSAVKPAIPSGVSAQPAQTSGFQARAPHIKPKIGVAAPVDTEDDDDGVVYSSARHSTKPKIGVPSGEPIIPTAPTSPTPIAPTGGSMMDDFVKAPSSGAVGNAFGFSQPEPPKESNVARFEAMFGGSSFKGGNQ